MFLDEWCALAKADKFFIQKSTHTVKVSVVNFFLFSIIRYVFLIFNSNNRLGMLGWIVMYLMPCLLFMLILFINTETPKFDCLSFTSLESKSVINQYLSVDLYLLYYFTLLCTCDLHQLQRLPGLVPSSKASGETVLD